jgi:thiosulfate/3-mercaptopyruvate sulfurtransferase
MAILISTDELASRLNDHDLVVVDVRWEQNGPDAGFNAYCSGHIPDAVFLDLDVDLADRSNLSRGRHPLPKPEQFAMTLARAGIDKQTKLIVYDDKAGSLAVRLWWMMRWIGGPEAALLDGGFTKWIREGRPVEVGRGRDRKLAINSLQPNVNQTLVASIDNVEAGAQGQRLLLDARASERYRGDVEPIDTRAGHIPGAINAPWMENLSGGPDQIFRSPSALRTHFASLGADHQRDIICYCGSGVTGCHDIFALELAGFPGARLYPGSWSEWIVKHP